MPRLANVTSLVGVTVFAVTLSAQGVLTQPRQWWQPLKYRTAWVLLGDVTRSGAAWETERSHVVRRSAERGRSVVPHIGDVIEFTRDDLQIAILDYKNQGERFADVSLAAHRVAPEDIVGVVGRGTRVVVADVVRAENLGPSKTESVFVRITPEDAVERRPLP